MIQELTITTNITSLSSVPVQQLWAPLIDFMNLAKSLRTYQLLSLNKVENPEDSLRPKEMIKVSFGTWEVMWSSLITSISIGCWTGR